MSSFPDGVFGIYLAFFDCAFLAFLQRAEAVFGELVRGIYLALDPVSRLVYLASGISLPFLYCAVFGFSPAYLEAVFGELVRGGIYLDFLRCAVFGELVRGIYLASDPVSFAPEPLLLAAGAPPKPPKCRVNNLFRILYT